jgi:hypothetical protein
MIKLTKKISNKNKYKNKYKKYSIKNHTIKNHTIKNYRIKKTHKINVLNGSKYSKIIKINSIEDNINYIKSEILKMPKSIQDIIIINKIKPIEQPNSNYCKLIKSIAINKLDKLLTDKCFNEQSLYDIGTTVIIDGFIVKKIPKGTNIYKGFVSFYKEQDIIQYSQQNINKAVWFGNKHVSYKWAKNLWGSLVSFKVIEDIHLIDFYNIHNIKKILELLEFLKEQEFIFDNKTKFINKIKMITGFNVSLLEQILFTQKINKYKELWIYTNTYKNKKIDSYCKYRQINGINPLHTYFISDSNFIFLFTSIINKMYNIDGFIKEQIYSSICANGVSDDEELILKNSSLLKKLKFDYDDPLCWVNWKNKKLKYYNLKTYAHYSNKNFVLSEFYYINTLKLVPLNNYNILSYNVNDFINLNIDIKYEANMNNIINLINYYKHNLDIITFQEILFIDNKTFNYFYNKIKDKFPYYYKCSNDRYKKHTNINILSIYVFTNKYYKSQIVNLQLTPKDIIYIKQKYNKLKNIIKNSISIVRDIIILDTEYGKIAFIHLEIGLHDFENKNSEIKKYNSELRIIMLKKILVYKPDIIIGDMNFTLDDKETNFLIKNNYYHQYNNNQNSTPYNRVDHCFIHKNIYNKNNKIINNNKLLKCNYSDHLPMFQKL